MREYYQQNRERILAASRARTEAARIVREQEEQERLRQKTSNKMVALLKVWNNKLKRRLKDDIQEEWIIKAIQSQISFNEDMIDEYEKTREDKIQ